MSEQRTQSGETPGKVRSLSARDAVGLTLLALGAFLSVSVSTDWLRGGDGGGANRSTALVVGLLGLLGPAPLFALGAAAAGLGAWLFGSKRRVLPLPLALGAAALVLAAPFAAAFVAPGSGGALGDLAAAAGAGTGLRVLALALFLILGGAGTYACFAAFGRGRALLALLSGGVSRATSAVKQSGESAPQPVAAPGVPVKAKAAEAGVAGGVAKGQAAKSAAPAQPKVSKDDGQQRIEGAHPGAKVRGAADALHVPQPGAPGAHLAARPQGGAAEAPAGTPTARPFVGAGGGPVPARAEAEPAKGLSSNQGGERGKPKEITLLVGGRPVERAGQPEVDYAEGSVGAVRPAGGVRALGTTPEPEAQPATIAHGGSGAADLARPLGTTPEAVAQAATIAHTQRADSARPLGTAPAPNPALGIAPLPLGAVGGAKARDIGTALAPESAAPVDEAPIAHPSAGGDRSRAVLDPTGSVERGAVEAAFGEALIAPPLELEEEVEEEEELEEEFEEEAELDEYDEEEESEEEEEDEDGEFAEADEQDESDELDEESEDDEEADEEELAEAEDEDFEESEESEESEEELEAYAEDEEADSEEEDEESEDEEELEADELDEEFEEVEASEDDPEETDDAEQEVETELVPHTPLAVSSKATVSSNATLPSKATAPLAHPSRVPPGVAAGPAASAATDAAAQAQRAPRRSARKEPEALPQPDLFDDGEPQGSDAEGDVGSAAEGVVLTPARPPADADSGSPSSSRRGRRKKPAPEAAVELADDERERLIHEAGLLFLDEGRVAVSLLQKRYSLDFQRSTEILDALQERGLIGPYLGGQRRDILMDKATWEAAQTAR